MVLMIEEIQTFLSYPQLPDLIAYILILVVYVIQDFVKKFVKKDNQKRSFYIDTKINKLRSYEKELKEQREKLIEEQKAFEEIKQSIQKEIDTIKQTIRITANNTKELVVSGIANKVDKMLPLDNDKTIVNLEVENTLNKEEIKDD